MSSEPRDYLQHIVLEANYLIGQTPGLSFEAFVTDETLRRAFVRSLEIIGEAAKKVPETDSRLLRRGRRVGLGRRPATYSGTA
jgi:uncharacterized protein with HEPN domain